MSETKHYDHDGSHVHLHNPETDGDWWCPTGVADVFVEARGWVYAPPPDNSLDGLFDPLPDPTIDEQTYFDPADHTVDEVNDYLAKHAHGAPGEVERVLALEAASEHPRITIVDPRDVDDPDATEGVPTGTAFNPDVD